MRRIFYIIMSLTLVLATTGLSISKHYCGNFLMNTSLGAHAKSCGMDSGCCAEQTETIIVDEDFQSSQSRINVVPEYDLLVAYFITEATTLNEVYLFQPLFTFDAGPPVETEPVYLKVQSLLL